MYVRQYRDAAEFSRLVAPTLEAYEAENNLVIGVIDGVIAGDYAGSRPFLAIVSPSPNPSASNISAVIVHTPPFPVLIGFTETAGEDSVARWVARALYDTCGTDIGGLHSDTRVIGPYIRQWCDLTGTMSHLAQRTRIYQATRAIAPKRVQGTWRRARSDDYATILGFLREFFKEAHPDEFDEERCRVLAKRYLADDVDRTGVLLWLEGRNVVSMAAYLGPTPHGVRVNGVYTTPDRRKRGFASACVATLTQQRHGFDRSISDSLAWKTTPFLGCFRSPYRAHRVVFDAFNERPLLQRNAGAGVLYPRAAV